MGKGYRPPALFILSSPCLTPSAGAHGSARSTTQYKEMQIHGPLDLREDVAALVLNRIHMTAANVHALADDFRAKFGANVIELWHYT